MCSVCSDENFDSAGGNGFRRAQVPQQVAFAQGPALDRKHYRTYLAAKASRFLQQIARWGRRINRREGWREIAFYRGGRIHTLSREPEEIFVSSDAIVEIHRTERGSKSRA